jgi:hypothetical protein
MAKRTIINSAPPKPSKRIIGGSNQRSKARLNLQGSYSWKYNHAPEDLDESKNLIWWQESANRYDAPLSSSSDLLYGRQAFKRELNRQTDIRKMYNFDVQVDNSIKGGGNQPYNKKQRLYDITFNSIESELDVTDEIYPNTKKRVSLKAVKDGVEYVAEQILPFSIFSSSINSGYHAGLSSSGFPGMDFTNLHEDKIEPYQGEIPAQGPFTERFVGGIQARHVAPLKTSDRKESFNLVLTPNTKATSEIHVLPGLVPSDLEFETLAVTVNGVAYSATFDDGVNKGDSTKTTIGTADCIDEEDVAEAIENSINLSISGDGLPITVSRTAGELEFTANQPGPDYNASWSSSASSLEISVVQNFIGGALLDGSLTRHTTGDTPKGHYLRGSGAKSPVNIKNIKTSLVENSVRIVGNYLRNYEVVQGSNRAATNMDLAYNTENYNYASPSAFVSTPARRALGLTGSADYPAPRQITSRKTNETIIVNRFSAPGDKVDSKQQFRDVASDQISSNNALPFRNLPVRNPYIKKLAAHTDFGGFEEGSTTIASVHKTQRNQTQRIKRVESTFLTGTVYDAYFVTRPVPAGDSTQWFFSLSGSDTVTYSDYVLANSKYPENISFSKTDIGSFDAGSGGVTGSDNNVNYIWSSDPYSAPWSQTRSSYKNGAIYLSKNNLYELDPDLVRGKNTISNSPSTKSRTSEDQAGNTITKFYSEQFREPPITCRYKPLVHQIESLIGSPSRTTSNKTTLNLEYSYGNSLMGFANRELNRQLAGDIKFSYNKLKRPYEILREQLSDGISRSLNGVSMIKMFAYNETIYPREIYTFLSGSRSRLAFRNLYWKNDASIQPVSTFYTNYNTLFYTPSIVTRDNRQAPRLSTAFTTSQGYGVEKVDQLPYNPLDATTPLPEGAGQASIWPLDSYLWSDLSDIYSGTTYETGSLSASVILADQATTACGELMMTNFGTIDDRITNSDPSKNTGISLPQSSNNSVSSQYVYSIAFATGTFVAGNYNAEPRIPGGAFSRPPWTAASERVFVDGEKKGTFAEKIYPFYNNYEDWASELRMVGKSHTIIPEYRVSEHVAKFKNKASVFTTISSSLEITGANTNNFDGTNTDFYTRYATTDNMEFLSDFMTYDKGDVNFIFNDYPRHFEISSDAIIKLLPYEGFYPVNRTLQISGLYSQSYGPHAQFNGTSTGLRQWRSLLRPFFAPGILYNSIKSGVSVDYPIRRRTRNEGGFTNRSSIIQDVSYPGYKIGYPLFGCLDEDITVVSGNLPTTSRRGRDSFDWTNSDVNALFWADRLPFESILSPEEYLSADLDTTTGSLATVMSDINTYLWADVTASYVAEDIDSNNLYKKSISNFLANVPQFFLRSKENKFGSTGKMTKFVSQFGSPSKGSQEVTAAARTVAIDPKKAYMMEIGLLKTDQFNLYSNPAAFGPATNTSYVFKPWEIAQASGSWVPSGSAWPTHRGEFAPFTPPYYYGPSLARITFMPIGDKKEYTLQEILENERGEVFVDYINESGSFYDAHSGSFVDAYGNTLTTNATPVYKWNRAWLNRMDVDASINIGNEFPVSANSTYRSSDPNKWTIMPKWECPILDFANEISAVSAAPATATITVNRYEDEPTATATGQIVLGSLATGDQVGTQNFSIPDGSVTINYIFNAATGTTSFNGVDTYEIGVSGSSDYFTAEEVRNALFTAIEDSRGSTGGNLNIAAPSKAGSYTIDVTAGTAGSAFNSNTITWSGGAGSTGATVSGFSGGANYTFNSKTLDLTDEVHGTVSYIFDAGTTPAGSTSTVIGTQGTTNATQVAGAIATTIGLSQLANNIDISVVSFPSTAVVNLVADDSGTGMNNQPIAGTAESDGGFSAVDFAGGVDRVDASRYGFSSSVNPGEFTKSTYGMWHQYGQSPDDGRGVFMYIKDIPTGENEEYDLVATCVAGADGHPTGSYNYVKKVPKFVIDSNRSVSSLADLCGFDPDEIIRKGFDPNKAKRLGEIASDGENSISEAVVAMPFYLDESREPKLITLQASPTELGPKIKEFRKNFTKYSLPPVLAQKLLGLVPKGYPIIPDTINPFGGDDYDEIMSGEDIKQIPVVYLMEHRATLSKQDLADIWQGIMPDLSRRLNFSFSAIDHYMPGENVSSEITRFPEVLKEQISLGAVRDGHPRYDLLDIAEKVCKQGFFPEIKWLVFKVKQRGFSTYSEMIMQEVDGPNALGYDNSKEFLTLQGLPSDQVDRILGDRDEFAKNAYISKHSLSDPTYNWPYDYCSLIESVKVGSKVGFRPDLKKEYLEEENRTIQETIDEKSRQ